MARKSARIGWLPTMSRARSHMTIPPEFSCWRRCPDRQSARVAAGGAELVEHALDELRRSGRRILLLVGELHRLPLEGAELMEWLHLDPGDVLHRRHEAGDAFDIGGVVGAPGHQREAHPGGLAERSEER